jgi:hypothetical protein
MKDRILIYGGLLVVIIVAFVSVWLGMKFPKTTITATIDQLDRCEHDKGQLRVYYYASLNEYQFTCKIPEKELWHEEQSLNN